MPINSVLFVNLLSEVAFLCNIIMVLLHTLTSWTTGQGDLKWHKQGLFDVL